MAPVEMGLNRRRGSDFLAGEDRPVEEDRQPDKLYCGKGKDEYGADKNDYVSSSCEKKPTAAADGGP